MELLTLLYALFAALVGFQQGDRATSPVMARVEVSASEQCAAYAVADVHAPVAIILNGRPAAVPDMASVFAGYDARPFSLVRRFGSGVFAILRE